MNPSRCGVPAIAIIWFAAVGCENNQVVTPQDITKLERFASRLDESPLSPQEKKIYKAIANDPKGCEVGLGDSPWGQTSPARLVWSESVVLDSGEHVLVCLFDFPPSSASSRQLESPLIVVGLDAESKSICYHGKVATWSSGFVSASLVGRDLTIRTRANWIDRIGVYEYVVSANDLVPKSSKFVDSKNEECVTPKDKFTREFYAAFDALCHHKNETGTERQ